MRKRRRVDFLQRAYDYIEANGECTAAHLLDVLRIRESTGRADANLPELSAVVQWLRIDKRFVSTGRYIPKVTGKSSYYLLKHYDIVRDEE